MERIESMRKMRNYEIRVFVCTDLISRGIDLEHVDLVVNVDVPQDWKTYIHRVGRCGRFGDKGAAFTLFHGEADFDRMKIIAKRCNLRNMMLVNRAEELPSAFITEDDEQLQQIFRKSFRNFCLSKQEEISENKQNGAQLDSMEIGRENGAPEQSSEEFKGHASSAYRPEELTIDPSLHSELEDLVRLYNSAFKKPLDKTKLNVDNFTYQSFKQHYNEFKDSGVFTPKPEWIKIESIPSEAIVLRNFLKPKEISTKESITQTEVFDEVQSTQSEEPDERPEVSSAADSGFNGCAQYYHLAFLNSAQKRYVSQMMNLYYGGDSQK